MLFGSTAREFYYKKPVRIQHSRMKALSRYLRSKSSALSHTFIISTMPGRIDAAVPIASRRNSH